jgi:hypothetical protein
MVVVVSRKGGKDGCLVFGVENGFSIFNFVIVNLID